VNVRLEARDGQRSRREPEDRIGRDRSQGEKKKEGQSEASKAQARVDNEARDARRKVRAGAGLREKMKRMAWEVGQVTVNEVWRGRWNEVDVGRCEVLAPEVGQRSERQSSLRAMSNIERCGEIWMISQNFLLPVGLKATQDITYWIYTVRSEKVMLFSLLKDGVLCERQSTYVLSNHGTQKRWSK